MAKSNGTAQDARRITSLADLPSRDIDVRVEVDGGDALLIPCRALTFKRYQEIGRMVAEPTPPVMAGPKGKIYDYQDPAYQDKRNEANEQRRYLRLAEFIRIDIPGTDLTSKAAWLADNLEMGVLMALARQMDSTLSGGNAAIEARAATFQSA